MEYEKWLLQQTNVVYDLIWSNWFWLPKNTTWDDVADFMTDYNPMLLFRHCLYVAFCLSMLRIFLTSLLFIPLGAYLGLKVPLTTKVPLISSLESVYMKNRRPSKETIMSLSKKLDMSTKAIDFWFHRRRNLGKKPGILKFSESGWKLCFYTTMFFYGLYALCDKNYLCDIKQSLMDYPYYQIPQEVHYYYAIELAYYLSEMFWVFYGVRRSDFAVLVIHHMTTVGLLSFSYVINHHRIGALILLLHDIADCWMESAKMFKYVNKHQVAEILFGIFMVVWIVTRMIYFPLWVIFTILTTYPYPPNPAYSIIVGWLILLQSMHVYWFVLIVRIAVQLKTQGDNAKDCRSDSDTSDDVVCPSEILSVSGVREPSAQSNGILPKVNLHSSKVVHRQTSAVLEESRRLSLY